MCPDGSYVRRTRPTCEFAECPATANTNSSTNQNTNTAPEVLPENVKRFTSDKLGITFTYLTTAKDYKATVQEVNDKVFINLNVSATNPITNGQWVQVFSKDPSDTLVQAITKRFLSGISVQDCFVTVQSRTNISSTQSAAIIDWPATLIDENNPFGDNSKCPKEYQKTNGERYFLVDSQDSTKLLFFSIGQYAIMGLNDNSTTWQQTLRMTKTDPTAGWKTYTNTALGFTVKYAAAWKISTCDGAETVWFGTQGVVCASDAGTWDFSVTGQSASFNLERTLTQTKKLMVEPMQTSVTIGGVAATRLRGQTKDDIGPGSNQFNDTIYIPHENRYYTIQYSADGVIGEEYKNTFELFTQSFAFIE